MTTDQTTETDIDDAPETDPQITPSRFRRLPLEVDAYPVPIKPVIGSEIGSFNAEMEQLANWSGGYVAVVGEDVCLIVTAGEGVETRAGQGQWILRTDDGHYRVVDVEHFEGDFEPVGEEPQA